MNISPNQQLPVSYTVSDPNDTTLYYVRAVVRDTQSSATIQSLNLTRVSSSPNRYVGILNPISDSSGLGRAVDVTITVYTDSGYSTPSGNYQLLQDAHLVIQPYLPTLGTGGASGFDYEKFTELMELLLKKRLGKSVRKISDGFGGVATPDQLLSIGNDLKNHHEMVADNTLSHVRGMLEGHMNKISDESLKNHQSHVESLGRIGEVIKSLIEHSKEVSKSSRENMLSSEMKGLMTMVESLKNELVKAHEVTSKRTVDHLKTLSPTLEKTMRDVLSDKEVNMHVHNHVDLNGMEKAKKLTQTMP